MNKIYKVIWSKTRNCYVAVAEFVKRNGKGGSVLNRRHIAAALAAVAISAAPVSALANTGGHWDGKFYIGDAPDYKVVIDSDVYGGVYGRSESGSTTATGASVTVTSGTIGYPHRIDVCGGRSQGGNASQNTVSISGGTVQWNVNGGGSESGNAEKNTVFISGGSVESVRGGESSSGDATNNTVTISSGTVNHVYGGYSDSGSVTKNTLTISGGTVNWNVNGGYSGSGSVTKNTLTISGGTVNWDVNGGYSGSGSATNNTVSISGGRVEKNAYGGSGTSATSNTVSISGGRVEKNVYGGIGESATSNTVAISGGEVNGTVYGGYSSDGDAVNNTVILSRQGSEAPPDINGTLFGGFSYGGGAVSGNTLQVEAVGLSAPEIQNFENYKFVLPKDIKAGDTMLTLKGQGADLTIDGTKVDMAVAKDGGLNIGFGESVTLLHKTGGTGAFSVTNLTSAVQTSKLDGVSTGFDVMKYKLDKPANEDKLNVTVSELFLYGDGGTNTLGQREMGNTLNITSGKANAAFGGRATSGDVTGNKVTMSGGELVVGSSTDPYAGNLYGGLAVDGAASGNKVTISGGTVNDGVYGGYSSAGNAEENAVTVSGKSNAGFVVGGYSEAGGFAKSNRVIIHNMTEGYQVASATGGVADTGRVENNSVTVEGAAITYDIDGGIGYREAIHNQVTLAKGEARGLLGGSGNVLVSQNTATLNEGGKTTYIYGGYAGSGIATKNEVIINGGTVDNQGVMEDAVYGGNAFNGDATYNKVTLNGGAINADVYGGHVWEPTSTGKATDNTVVLDTGATGKIFNSNLYGGKTNGSGDDISGNSLQVKGKGIAVTSINNFENYNFVLPADSKAGDTMLKLTGQGAGLTIDGSTVGVSLAKGTLADIGLKLDESVTLLEKTGGNGTFTVDNTYLAVHEKPLDDVAGGLPVDIYRVTASEDTLNVTYTEHYLYGDGGTNTTGQRETGNTLTITSGKATAGFGGRASSGDVTKNNVEMSGGELVYDTLYADIQGSLYGGLTDKGNANHNTVTVSGGKLKERVYGGASYDGNTENNTVTIKGGTVGTHVYGGRTYGGGNAVNNTVTIEGGTVGKRVYGGRSDGGGNAVNNTVTIKGGTVGERVYGGYAYGAATGNAVNLTGTTHGLDGAKLYGYNNSATSHSGNELHIGGAKTYDENGEAVITKGSWQGMDGSGKRTNRVDTVSNFDSIALHHVVWGDVPAISANEITNIGGLDVTGLEFFTHPDNSTVHEHAYKDYMVLVHADTNDLTGLKISYLDEGNVKTETLTNQGIHYHTAPHSSTENGVTVDGTEKKRIYLADHNKSVDFCFHVTGDKLTVGEVDFVKNGTARILDGRFDVRNAVIDAGGLTFSEASWNRMHTGDTMTIVDAEDAVANKNGATLQPFATKQLTDAYSFTPAEGVTVAARITGSLGTTPKGDGFTYTVNSNQADKLTFGSVDWKDSGALFKRPAAVTFAGSAVDTSEIHFKNLKELKGNAQMTLVSDFGGNPGRITGTTYKIGTTLEGEGAASLVNGDLIFTTKAGTKNHAQEQTHNTVMGMTAGLAALSGGTEQISQAMDILSLMDGFGGTTGSGSSGGGGAGQEENEREANGSIIASVGGGHMHQETGSHVTSNTWNGVLGIGGKRAVKSGTWQYAAFAEHGRANFTLHSDAGRGDGTSKYTGGGLLAKWQSRHDVYVEGSLRAGRMHDTASDMLYDAATGQSYGYDVHANYIGGHVGLGKVFRYNNGRSLDVYGKYFHMKRDGVSFKAEGHYDLDSVTSSVLRVGARYGATDKKWNWYGGLAYEYEFDGKATGRADGAEIRAASIKGGSVRGELGIRMEATKTSPWKADIRLTGYAGKRRGIGGNVSVAYTF